MLFSFDKFDRYEIPVLTVAHPDFTKVGIIKDPIGLKLDLNLVSTSKASFEAYSVDDTGNATFYYGALTKYNLVHISGFGWFVITNVDESNESYVEEVPDYPVNLFFSKEGYFKKITPQSLRMSSEQKLKEGDTFLCCL